MSEVTPHLQWEIEQFLYQEAALLDRHEYREWLGLFTQDLVYRMPTLSNDHEQAIGTPPPSTAVAYYFDETLPLLEQRIKRLETGKAWAEMPPSRTRRMLSNVMLRPTGNEGEWDVQCNFLLYRSRLERQVDVFVGSRIDRLRQDTGSAAWKISRREIILDQGTLLANNLSIFF